MFYSFGQFVVSQIYSATFYKLCRRQNLDCSYADSSDFGVRRNIREELSEKEMVVQQIFQLLGSTSKKREQKTKLRLSLYPFYI